jgi:hypothetical protein
VLAVLGVQRTHQQNFVLFLGVVLAVSVLVLVVHLVTAQGDRPE